MLALGCDHGGYELMNEIIKYLEVENIAYENFGTFSNEAVDYPVYAKKVANAILDKKADMGVLICGTGIGISITANKFEGIRAALCTNTFMATATREHNDANILCMGGRVTNKEEALEIFKAFYQTKFSNEERHLNRINQIEN